VRLDAWAATDVGRRRESNEDSFLVDPSLGLWIVADGIGGSAAGDVASARCVEFIRAEVAARRADVERLAALDGPEARAELQRLLADVLRLACRALYDLAQSDARWRGMGTTCVAALQCGRKVAIAHVGDSRAYLARHGRAHRLTADHSLVSEQLRRGLITSEQAHVSELRHVVTRAMGTHPSVEVDVLVVDVVPGDVVVLTTDGVHDAIADEVEFAAFCAAEPTATVASRLVKVADERGGHDNATAVVLRVRSADAPMPDADAASRTELLRAIPLFRFMTYKELLSLMSVARERAMAEGETLVSEGEAGDELFVLVDGEVEVSKGGRAVTRFSKGGHFGEMSLVDLAPRSASVTAVVPGRVLVLRREPLMQLLRTDATLAVKLLWAFVQVSSERLRHTTEIVTGLQHAVERLSMSPPEDVPLPPPFEEE
jgi:serine/threonine protein phosphatase PrpC